MITSLLVWARYLWISDFVSTWPQLPLHTVLDQRRERWSSTWAYSSVDLERLHHNLVNCSHVTGRCVNSRQISDDILRDLNLVTNRNIESCPAIALHEVALGSKVNSSFLLPLRSLQLLSRRMFSRVDRSDHQLCMKWQPRLLKNQWVFSLS